MFHLSLFFILIFIHCAIATAAKPHYFAAGSFYDKRSEKWIPTIISSEDDGANWTQIETAKSLSLNGEGRIAALTMVDENYIGVGEVNGVPLVVISKDRGANWSLPQTFSAPIGTVINAAKCFGTTCIAGGYYGFAYISRLFLVVSTDKGDSWSIKENIKDLPTQFSFSKALIASVSCTSLGICMAVGEFNYAPLLLSSFDYGKTWSYNPQASTFSPGAKEANLSSVYCYGSTCMAAGTARTEDYRFTPFIAISRNAGRSWTVQQTFENAPNLKGNLEHIKCVYSTCLAVGSVQGNQVAPLILISKDFGRSWKYAPIGDITPRSRGLISVQKIDSTWIAIGNDALEHPTIIISHDSENWYEVKNIAGLPYDTHFVRLLSINCSTTSCFAAGWYTKLFTDTKEPLLLVSYDKGESWFNARVHLLENEAVQGVIFSAGE